MKYLLLLLTVPLFTSCEEFGCECGDVVNESIDPVDGLVIYRIENQCSGNRRDFKFLSGVEFESNTSQNLINANQNQTKIYCHNTTW